MANANKRKGDAFERAVVGAMRQAGWLVARTKAGAQHDVGDIAGDNAAAYECRARSGSNVSWPAALRSAQQHAAAAGKPHGIAVCKQPRQPVGSSVVVMTLDAYLALRRSPAAGSADETAAVCYAGALR